MEREQRIIVYILLVILIVTAAAFFVVKTRKMRLSETRIFVYFAGYDQEQQKAYLVPLDRMIEKAESLEEKIKFTMEHLFTGLSEQEMEETGLTNTVPENAKLLNVSIEGDIVYLDFSKEIEQGGGTEMMTDRLAQIVFTATQFYPISKVRIMINGELIKYFSGEGITDVESPMDRNNFQLEVRNK